MDPSSSAHQEAKNLPLSALTAAQLFELKEHQKEAFESPGIQALLKVDALTVEQVLRFRYWHMAAFQSETIQALLAASTLTVEQVLKFDGHHRWAFESETVQTYLRAGTLTVEQVLRFNYSDQPTLESQRIQALLTAGTLTIEQILGFHRHHQRAFESETIQALLTSEDLSAEQVLGFDGHHKQAFESEIVQAHLTANSFTIGQVLDFEEYHLAALESLAIQALLTADTLTSQHVLRFGWHHQRAFESETIQALLTADTLTVEQVLGFEGRHLGVFENEIIQDLIRTNQVTPTQILLLDEPSARALTNLTVVARLMPIDAPVVINNQQSTHNAAVHQSVSASAGRLNTRYRDEISGTGLGAVIEKIRTYVSGLEASVINTAAQRCIQRITAPDYTYSDGTSGLSVRQLLALSFIAINDESQRAGTLQDGQEQFVHALYEIQRGYNLSLSGRDNGRDDHSICIAGTFNKLIEKLEGIHPDCDLRFMTRETAALKLPKVVQEEAIRHLSQQANPQTSAEFLAFTRLMAEVKEDALEPIYEAIKPAVSERMFAEFGPLYSGQDDPAFAGFIDAGEYLQIKGLGQFQESLQNSEGYRQHCAEILLPGRGLFLSYNADRQQNASQASLPEAPERSTQGPRLI